jgi:putative transposase
MQNGFVESFNGSFRDQCLNETQFTTLAQARSQITVWKITTQTDRTPHWETSRPMNSQGK